MMSNYPRQSMWLPITHWGKQYIIDTNALYTFCVGTHCLDMWNMWYFSLNMCCNIQSMHYMQINLCVFFCPCDRFAKCKAKLNALHFSFVFLILQAQRMNRGSGLKQKLKTSMLKQMKQTWYSCPNEHIASYRKWES